MKQLTIIFFTIFLFINIKTTVAQTDKNIESKVFEIASEKFHIPLNQITLNSSFSNDLKSDEISFVAFIMKIEDVFQINIPAETSEKFTKLIDVVQYIQANPKAVKR